MADQQPLHVFAQWVAGCSGNEKQEAQAFVQRLLSAWVQAEFIVHMAGMEDYSRYRHQLPQLQSVALLNLLFVTK
jgi:hypothetical protein